MTSPTHSHRSALRFAIAAVAHLWSSEVNEAAIALLKPTEGEHIVDLGAGLGPATFVTARQVGIDGSVTAIDPSRAMRTALRARRRFLPGRQRIWIRPGVAESMPLPDASIDAAVALNIAHLLTDLDRAASELARIIKPTGRVLFVEEDLDHPDHTFHQSTPHSPGGPELPDLVAALSTAGFITQFDHRELGGEPVHTLAAAGPG